MVTTSKVGVGDLIDLQGSEETMRSKNPLLQLVMDSLPVGVAIMDLSGNIVLTNHASRQIWGGSIRSGPARYSESKGWWHATGHRIGPQEWASVRALAEGETSLNEVIDIEAFDGTRKTIHNSAIPVFDAKGRIAAAVVLNEDISARKKVERELSESHNERLSLTEQLVQAQDRGHRLSTWKEIAIYLGKDVRTVQRWERRWGLPIRRPHNRAIFALSSEIYAWIEKTPLSQPKMIEPCTVNKVKR